MEKHLQHKSIKKMVDEYTEVIKLTQGVSALNDDQPDSSERPSMAILRK